MINFPFISRNDVQWRYWLRLTLPIVIGIIAPQEIANAQMGASHLDYGDDFGGGSSLSLKELFIILGSLGLTLWLSTESKNGWGWAVFYLGGPCLAFGLSILGQYYKLWEPRPTSRTFNDDDAMFAWLLLSAFVYFVYKSQCEDNSEKKA